jgi:hypothetical protein
MCTILFYTLTPKLAYPTDQLIIAATQTAPVNLSYAPDPLKPHLIPTTPTRTPNPRPFSPIPFFIELGSGDSRERRRPRGRATARVSGCGCGGGAPSSASFLSCGSLAAAARWGCSGAPRWKGQPAGKTSVMAIRVPAWWWAFSRVLRVACIQFHVCASLGFHRFVWIFFYFRVMAAHWIHLFLERWASTWILGDPTPPTRTN